MPSLVRLTGGTGYGEEMIKVYFADKYVGTADNMEDAVTGLKILTEGATLLFTKSDEELRATYMFARFTDRLDSPDWAPLNLSDKPVGALFRTDFSDDQQVTEARDRSGIKSGEAKRKVYLEYGQDEGGQGLHHRRGGERRRGVFPSVSTSEWKGHGNQPSEGNCCATGGCG